MTAGDHERPWSSLRGNGSPKGRPISSPLWSLAILPAFVFARSASIAAIAAAWSFFLFLYALPENLVKVLNIRRKRPKRVENWCTQNHYKRYIHAFHIQLVKKKPYCNCQFFLFRRCLGLVSQRLFLSCCSFYYSGFCGVVVHCLL